MESVSSLTPEEIAYYQAHADDNRQSSKTAANVVGIVLTIIAVAARLLARFRSRARLSWDDYLIFLALVNRPQKCSRETFTVANKQWVDGPTFLCHLVISV